LINKSDAGERPSRKVWGWIVVVFLVKAVLELLPKCQIQWTMRPVIESVGTPGEVAE
jgi:hypothetical protein